MELSSNGATECFNDTSLIQDSDIPLLHNTTMTWISTIPPAHTGEKLRVAMEAQSALYPVEYRTPVEGAETAEENERGGAGIVNSHSLIPDALYHAFSTYGTLLSPNLPLSRQQHEMIAATVSALNRCFY